MVIVFPSSSLGRMRMSVVAMLINVLNKLKKNNNKRERRRRKMKRKGSKKWRQRKRIRKRKGEREKELLVLMSKFYRLNPGRS